MHDDVTTRPPAPWVPHAVMLVVIAAWSGSYTMIKIALEELTALDVALARFLVAAPAFALLLLATGLPRFSRAEWPRVLLVSFLPVGGYHLALNLGETAISAGVAALIVATGPVLTALFSSLLLKERLGGRKIAGLAVAVGGVAVLVVGRGDGFSVTYALGAFVALLAPAMWALSTVLSKPLLAGRSVFAFSAATTLLGTLMLAPIAATGTVPRVADASAGTWAALLHLGLFAGFVGYVGFYYALRHLPPTNVMAWVYLNPLAALGWARALKGEPLTTFIVTGAVLVLAGVAVTNWPVSGRKPAPPTPKVIPNVAIEPEPR